MADTATPSSIEAVEEGRQRLVSGERAGNRTRTRSRRTRDPCGPATMRKVYGSIFALFCLVVSGIYLTFRIETDGTLTDGIIAIAWVWGFVALLYCMDSWAPTTVFEFIARVFAFVALVAFGIFAHFALIRIDRKGFAIYTAISVTCFGVFMGLLFYSCRHLRLVYAASMQRDAELRRASRNRYRQIVDDSQTSSSRPHGRHTTVTQHQTTRPIAGATDTQTAADQSPDTLGEAEAILQLSIADEVCTVKKVSEVASAISQIVSESVSEKTAENVVAGQTSSAGDGVVKASSESSQKIESDTEGMSSGELRRRTLLHRPIAFRKASNSSDEEPKKE